jgi:outer membrane protein OmpA-like peptidoglycan-associated protein
MKLRSALSIWLFILIICSGGISVLASQDKLEHPVIKPMPGAVLKERSSNRENFSTYQFSLKVGNSTRNVEKGGQFWNLRYEIRDAGGNIDRSTSITEIIENYSAATREKGGKVHKRGSNNLVFSIPREDGGTSWAKLVGSAGRYVLYIIDEKPLDPVLSFGAEELKKALDAEGRVAVYGINFAVDKAVLELGAEDVIKEFVKLMQFYPELKIEIQGHTDNTGSAQHNLQLSNRRAGAVKQYMLLFGVDPARAISKGYGMTQPIADNGTEEGRAKNRRVELVKIK